MPERGELYHTNRAMHSADFVSLKTFEHVNMLIQTLRPMKTFAHVNMLMFLSLARLLVIKGAFRMETTFPGA